MTTRMRIALSIIVFMADMLCGPSSSAHAASPTMVRTYETPCHQRERVARGIPRPSVHEDRGLMVYIRAHLNGSHPDGPLADYWAALAECDRTQPVARWDWSSMVLVNVEYLG